MKLALIVSIAFIGLVVIKIYQSVKAIRASENYMRNQGEQRQTNVG